MSLLPLLLLVQLALLGTTPSASMTTSVWHRAQVSRDQLAAAAAAAAKYKNYQVVDEIPCAMLANQQPWCHVFTYEGNTCVLYDVVVDSLADPPPVESATP